MNDSFFTGLLQGFTGRKREVEKENIRQADLASEREQRVLMTLLQADDPEVRNLALSGLIDTAGPGKKAKGLGGWIGQRQQSPVFGQLQQVLNTPTMQPVEEQKTTLPAKQFAGGAALGQTPQGMGVEAPPTPQAAITTPPSGGGMAPTSPVQPGAPPPTPVSVVQAPPTPYSITQMAMRPRQVFMSPIDKYTQEQIAKNRADIEGDVQAYMALNGGDRKAALQQVMLERLHNRGGGISAARAQAGSAPDAEGNLQPAWAVWHPALMQFVHPGTTTPFPEFQPTPPRSATPATHFYGVDAESISKEAAFGGIPFAQQTPEGAAKVNAEVQRRKIETAGQREAATGAQRNITRMGAPLSPEQAATQGVPFGTSMANLQGLKPITGPERVRYDAAKALAPQITEIADLIRTVFPSGTGLRGAIQASQVLAAKRLRRDPDMQRLEGALQRATGNIARVLNAESGRLTQQDIERAQKSLLDISGFTDTQESALAKLQDVEQALTRVTEDITPPGARIAPPRPQAAPQTAPAAAPAGPPGLFVGKDGQFHTGTPDGPIWKPGQ